MNNHNPYSTQVLAPLYIYLLSWFMLLFYIETKVLYATEILAPYCNSSSSFDQTRQWFFIIESGF